jgi:excisionase family DNA binding protein
VAEPWLSADDIAAHLGVTKDTVYTWIAEKAMPAHKVGRLWKFQASEIDDWVRHQITAVYESMLPRQPLRYVLADDPGAGKTIMAGLFIRELLMRADAKRVLIVAPGSLVEQWQDEMFEKFGLTFTLFSREQVEQSRSGNPSTTST